MNTRTKKLVSDSKKKFSLWTTFKALILIFLIYFIFLNLFPCGYTVINYDDIFDNLKLIKSYGSKKKDLDFLDLHLKIIDKNLSLYHRVHGFKLNPAIGHFQNRPKFYTQSSKENLLKISQNNPEQEFIFVLKSIQTNQDDTKCYNVSISHKENSSIDQETCFELNGYWFGGHESYGQPYWPINPQKFDYVPYVTGFADDWSAVLERYWISSSGVAIFIDDSIPLMVKHLDPDKICLKSSKDSLPYSFTPVYSNKFEYTICKASDIKKLQLFMIDNYLGRPKSIPDLTMMRKPVFTTWNFFFRNISQKVVLDYAREIYRHEYSISQLEIDDKWEVSYGDLDFDVVKFPNPAQMTNELHKMAMRATLWVHPFCNIDSYNFVPGVEKNFWVKDSSGDHPGLTKWWNGQNSAILDTTNPDSVKYFKSKLESLKSNYGIDSFKFDAGETAWIPKQFKLFNNNSYPDSYAQNYAKMATTQGSYVEIRVGHRTQSLGVFHRILDRSTDWSIHDGIKSVITETLQFGILGYPFVLPDIIGGNDDPNKNNKELFIRWTQMTAFLPAMQFGVPPWYFDEETNKICKSFVEIHSEIIYPYISKYLLNGLPIIRPLWWLEPTNLNVFNISDQFLVGDDMLVAPILEPGVKSRNIYFPPSKWFDPISLITVQGPIWKRFDVNISSIPFFVSENGKKKFKEIFTWKSKFHWNNKNSD